MPPDPSTVSGLRSSVSQGTCLLTGQGPSTSKVNENPAIDDGYISIYIHMMLTLKIHVFKREIEMLNCMILTVFSARYVKA